VLRVGLTGGVASGKSTVAKMLAGRGAVCLDADQVVAALYGPGQPGALIVAEVVGGEVLAGDGSVDRARLAARILEDAALRQRLEARVHPLVRAEIRAFFQRLAAAPTPPAVAVVEAALLVETGSYRDFDALVVVVSPLALRRQRALAAGWPAARFDGVVAAQASDEERRRVAQFVITNDGDLANLEGQVAALWERLLAQAAEQ